MKWWLFSHHPIHQGRQSTACQPVRIQVEKVLTQHLGETDAQSVTRDWRVKAVLLTLKDGPLGLHLGPIQGRLANPETPLRSQYPLEPGKLTSPSQWI